MAMGSIDYDDCHDEETLCRALRQSLRVRVSIERKSDWGLATVPIMRVDGVWKDDHLDAYWRAFVSYCRWPERKENARLEAYDTDPALARSDGKRIVLFYRGDTRQLVVWVKREHDALARSEVLRGVSLQKLRAVQSLGDAALL